MNMKNAKQKHSKFRNTFLLHESMIRKIVEDNLNNSISKRFLSVYKKYFSTGKLLREELDLYETLLEKNVNDYTDSKELLQEVLDSRKKMDQETIEKTKYNLIKDLKGNGIELKEFFSHQYKNYKECASIFLLFESLYKDEHAELLFEYKKVVKKNLLKEKTIIPDFDEKFSDKTTNKLTTRILYQSLKESINDLNNSQQDIFNAILKFQLKNEKGPLLEQIRILKSKKRQMKYIDDPALRIKLSTIVESLGNIDKDNITDDTIEYVLNVHEIIDDMDQLV